MQPFSLEPFDFGSYNWVGSENGSSANYSGPSASALRLWAKHFSSKDHGLPFASIPFEWIDFFTLLLLKDSSNEWATQFLQSSAWSHLTSSPSGNCFLFSLPKNLLFSFLNSVVLILMIQRNKAIWITLNPLMALHQALFSSLHQIINPIMSLKSLFLLLLQRKVTREVRNLSSLNLKLDAVSEFIPQIRGLSPPSVKTKVVLAMILSPL